MRIDDMNRHGKRWAGALLLCAALAGCGKARDAGAKEPPITGDATVSLEALADSVRARAARGDTAGLFRLQVDDSTFRHYVYPASPAYDSSRPEVFAFVLSMHKSNSLKGVGRVLHDLVVDTAARVASPVFAESLPARGARLYTGFRPDPSRLQPFGSALCRAGGCQVVSYGGAGIRIPSDENP
jgi:hypothetical protein